MFMYDSACVFAPPAFPVLQAPPPRGHLLPITSIPFGDRNSRLFLGWLLRTGWASLAALVLLHGG